MKIANHSVILPFISAGFMVNSADIAQQSDRPNLLRAGILS